MTTKLKFTTFTEKDYPTIKTFTDSVTPNEPINIEQTSSFDEKRNVKRILVWNSDQSNPNLLAYYDYRPDANYDANGSTIKIVYNPSLTEETLDTIYQDLFQRLIVTEPNYLKTIVKEDIPELLQLFKKENYVELERMWHSTLSLDSFNKTIFGNIIDSVAAKGISFKTLADLPQDSDTKKAFYNCTIACLADVPSVENIEPWPFKTWEKNFWNGPTFTPESIFVAFDGETLVGQSQLRPSPKENTISTGLTGVIASHRGKGIARALKLLATTYAVDNNYQSITTTNHSTNQPMLRINETMGYVKSPALIILKKVL